MGQRTELQEDSSLNAEPPIFARIRELLKPDPEGRPICREARELLEQALVEETLRHTFKVTEEQPHLEPELIGMNGNPPGDI